MSRDLILIALSLMTWGIGEGMFMPFQTPYLEQMGADSLQIGRILGLVGMAMAITHLPAGFLSDRMGRRPLLLTAWGIGAVATWAMALAPNLSLFVTGAILYGFTAFVMTPLNSYITSARRQSECGQGAHPDLCRLQCWCDCWPLVGRDYRGTVFSAGKFYRRRSDFYYLHDHHIFHPSTTSAERPTTGPPDFQ